MGSAVKSFKCTSRDGKTVVTIPGTPDQRHRIRILEKSGYRIEQLKVDKEEKPAEVVQPDPAGLVPDSNTDPKLGPQSAPKGPKPGKPTGQTIDFESGQRLKVSPGEGGTVKVGLIGERGGFKWLDQLKSDTLVDVCGLLGIDGGEEPLVAITEEAVRRINSPSE